MKSVRRQPNMKLKDIQDAVHEKFTQNITPGKASRAREKVSEYVDGLTHSSTINFGSIVRS